MFSNTNFPWTTQQLINILCSIVDHCSKIPAYPSDRFYVNRVSFDYITIHFVDSYLKSQFIGRICYIYDYNSSDKPIDGVIDKNTFETCSSIKWDQVSEIAKLVADSNYQDGPNYLLVCLAKFDNNWVFVWSCICEHEPLNFNLDKFKHWINEQLDLINLEGNNDLTGPFSFSPAARVTEIMIVKISEINYFDNTVVNKICPARMNRH